MYTHILDDEVLISRWFPVFIRYAVVELRWPWCISARERDGLMWPWTLWALKAHLKVGGGQVGKLKLEFWEVPNIYKYDQICKYTCIYKYIYTYMIWFYVSVSILLLNLDEPDLNWKYKKSISDYLCTAFMNLFAWYAETTTYHNHTDVSGTRWSPLDDPSVAAVDLQTMMTTPYTCLFLNEILHRAHANSTVSVCQGIAVCNGHSTDPKWCRRYICSELQPSKNC